MTVLVTGATGFLGSALVRRLLADGVRVRALVRTPSKSPALAASDVEVVGGDITDGKAVRAALDGVQVVYHLAGTLLTPGLPSDRYRSTHVDGTRTLLSCCAEQPGLERLVHCSTTGVLGATGEEPADEDAEFQPRNVYEETKAEAELAVRAAWHEGLPAVVVRPGLVYGPGDLHLLGFFRKVLARQFRPIGTRRVWLHPIYVDDLTEAFVRCGRLPVALRECFHVAGPEPVTLSGLAAAIAAAGGTDLPRGRIPLPAAHAVAAVGDLLPGKLKAAAPLTRTRLDFLTHSRVYDVRKAERLLSFVATTDLATGLARSLAWYRSNGYLPAASTA